MGLIGRLGRFDGKTFKDGPSVRAKNAKEGHTLVPLQSCGRSLSTHKILQVEKQKTTNSWVGLVTRVTMKFAANDKP